LNNFEGGKRMLSPELQARIVEWRRKSLDGTITLEEQREAVKLMREGRLAAAQAQSAARRKKAVAEIKSADDMLDELDSI
jgi:hypothetical protein